MAQTKYLDLTGLTYFWKKAKAYVDAADAKKVDKTTTVNSKPLSANVVIGGSDIIVGGIGTYKSSTVLEAIDALDAAVKAASAAGVTSFGGKTGAITITKGAGNVAFTMSENNLVGNVDLSGKADKTHTHATSDIAGLDTALAGKATKTVALKSVSGTAAGNASNVTITLITTTESGTTAKPTITLPVATDANQGTTTWGKIKELARAEAETVAGSVYKVKGTKATIDEVLELGSAAVGDTYNVTAAFTLNSQKYPAGTNVVFVGPGKGEPDPSDQTQWDALGGTVDLSPYATTAAMNSALANKADKTHTHTASQITDLQGKLDAKVNKTTTINTKPLSSNVVLGGADIALTGYAKPGATSAVGATDTINAAIGKLEKGLDGKAATSHTHTAAQITDLQGKLDAKVNVSDLVAITTTEIDGLFA